MGGYVTRTRRHGNPLGSPRGDFLRCRLRRRTTATAEGGEGGAPNVSPTQRGTTKGFLSVPVAMEQPGIAGSTTVFDFRVDRNARERVAGGGLIKKVEDTRTSSVYQSNEKGRKAYPRLWMIG